MKLKGKVLGAKVHDIGYRVFLARKALELGIERFNAFNTIENGLQAVNFYVEGLDDVLMAFRSFAGENYPEHAEVSEITFEEYSGHVMAIVDYMHLFQSEQLSKGIPAIVDIKDNTKKMLEKQDRMLEKQDRMLEKQDRMLEKQDIMIEKLDETRTEIVSEIREMRGDLKSYLDRRLIKIEGDITEIKAKIGLS